jgi:hypothetical protein
MRARSALEALVVGCAVGCGGTIGVGGEPGTDGGGDMATPGRVDLAAPPAADLSMPMPALDPCRAAQFGNGGYCGSGLPGGDPSALYDCENGKTASKTICPNGCHPAPPHMNDYCENPNGYHLPWTCAQTFTVTQGNHGDICGSNNGDHTGVQAFAWDFGLRRHTPVVAARGGTVTLVANVVGPGQNCYDGCTQPFGTQAFWQCCNACINTSNHVNIDHGDGTVATYWHLDVATAQMGQQVHWGDVIGYSGTSGCSSGPHLHYMVMGNCPTGYCQSVATTFIEAGVPACGQSVTSQNGCP